MISDKSANAIIVVVTTIWAVNILAGMVPFLDHEPSEAVNGIFLVVVGGAFELRRRAKASGNDE